MNRPDIVPWLSIWKWNIHFAGDSGPFRAWPDECKWARNGFSFSLKTTCMLGMDAEGNMSNNWCRLIQLITFLTGKTKKWSQTNLQRDLFLFWHSLLAAILNSHPPLNIALPKCVGTHLSCAIQGLGKAFWKYLQTSTLGLCQLIWQWIKSPLCPAIYLHTSVFAHICIWNKIRSQNWMQTHWQVWCHCKYCHCAPMKFLSLTVNVLPLIETFKNCTWITIVWTQSIHTTLPVWLLWEHWAWRTTTFPLLTKMPLQRSEILRDCILLTIQFMLWILISFFILHLSRYWRCKTTDWQTLINLPLFHWQSFTKCFLFVTT